MTGFASRIDPDQGACLDKLTAETEEGRQFLTKAYQNQTYREYAQEMLTWLNKRGALDV